MPVPNDSLITLPNVPIAEVGEDWHTTTGDFTFTTTDLMAAVNAVDDPAIKTPRLKLGHMDPRFTPDGPGMFDGSPALGKFINMRMTDNGQTLVADIAGVPKWLADVMPTAYPSRSIEGYWDVTTATGHKHQFVVTAVSLLGVELPAVETLEDLTVLLSAEGPDGVQIVDGARVAASRGGNMPDRVAASVATEDVRRAFFENVAVDERQWWWIHAVYFDPPIIIADDEQGGFFAVPFKTSGDEVTFKEPVEVRIQYVNKDTGAVAAGKQHRGEPVKVFASAAESRPTTTKEEDVSDIDRSVLIQRLGLPEDATDENINEKLAEGIPAAGPAADPPADPPEGGEGEPEGGEPEGEGAGEPEGAPVPEPVAASDGTVRVEKEAWERNQAAIARFEAQEKVNQRSERDKTISDAVQAGKFSKSRADHWRKLWDADPEGAKATIASLAPDVIPVTERGSAPAEEDLSQEAYPASWFPELQAKNNNQSRVAQEA